MRSAGVSTSARISEALRIEARGFFSSWPRSAANDSVNRAWSSRRWVSSSRARASSPISSRRREPRKWPRSRPRRSRIARDSSRSRRRGRTNVVDTSRLRTAATATDVRNTLNTLRRVWSRARKSRFVDCETSTAPTTRPPSQTGSALKRVIDRRPPGEARVRAPYRPASAARTSGVPRTSDGPGASITSGSAGGPPRGLARLAGRATRPPGTADRPAPGAGVSALGVRPRAAGPGGSSPRGSVPRGPRCGAAPPIAGAAAREAPRPPRAGGGRAPRAPRRGPGLPDHRALLRVEELPLVHVEVVHAGHRQEDEQQVEGKEPDRHPGHQAEHPAHAKSSRYR